jgi:hypothetical protein
VHAAFVSRETADGAPPASVNASSAVTKRGYTLHCVLFASRTAAECTTGTAVVSFPLPAKAAPKPETTREGEEQVGSTSHVADAKFCSEHTCIGNFTTEGGTVVECSDATFSDAGGIQGACSHHGGERK